MRDHHVVLAAYDALLATHPDLQRKGATMPYTSMKGHMFSFLTPDGTLALRLAASDLTAVQDQYASRPVEQQRPRRRRDRVGRIGHGRLPCRR